MLQLLTGVVVGAAATVLGWYLNEHSTSRREVAQRRRDASEQWLKALVDIEMNFYAHSEPGDVKALAEECRREWLRYSGRVPGEVADRIVPVYMVLFIYGRPTPDATRPRSDGGILGDNQSSDAWVVRDAFRSAIDALDAYVLGEALPPRSFPAEHEISDALENAGASVGLGVLAPLIADLQLRRARAGERLAS